LRAYTVELDISDIETTAHQNFLDYIRNDKTKTKYSNDLKKFLDLIPDKIYEDNDIVSTDKTEAFVTLVRADVKTGKSIVNAYVRELKKKIEDDHTGLESNYERYQEEDFERFPEYQKAIPFLTISDEERIRLENEKLKEEKSENQKLRERLDVIQEDLDKVKQWREITQKYEKK